MHDVIEKIVIYETPPEPNDLKSPAQVRMEADALIALNEWRLLTAGLATWRDLGYGEPVPEPKLLEMLTVDEEIAQARRRRRKVEAERGNVAI